MIFGDCLHRCRTGVTMTEEEFWAEISEEERSPEPQSGGGVVD
jgi:hypothetical protein